MSGTSMDGVDAAVVEINEKSINVISTFNKPYDDELKQELLLMRDNIKSINLDNIIINSINKYILSIVLIQILIVNYKI